MRDGSPSQTAQYIAFCRALETLEQPAQRLFDDPYAFALLSNPYRVFARLSYIPILRKLIYAILDLVLPYTRSSAVVRTRAIDDLVREAIRSGVSQLVLLGAGFDSRGYRLEEVREITVFEVDHPATQQIKKERLKTYMGRLPRNIRYVAVDFEKDNLEAGLVESGYDPATPAIVVWEGVIDYLTESAVQSTFASISRLLTPSSFLIFTYTDLRVLKETKAPTYVRLWRFWTSISGEPFTYALDPDTLAEMLKSYQFLLQSDVSTAEIAERYCRPLGRREPGNRAYRIATAIRMNYPVQKP